MPIYNLREVQLAAKKGKIRYRGRKVNNDIANLGYDLKEVINCISQLEVSDFNKSLTYENSPIADDAYFFTNHFKSRESGDVKIDRLYIKFRYLNDMISIGSFHL